MADRASPYSRLCFGVFELDLQAGELRKSGVLLHLPPQPFKILALLASRPAELVTREEIRSQVWGADTFVDFEHGLNFAIKKIRDALGDDPETPRYIQTLPRRGYRFIAPVGVMAGPRARSGACPGWAPARGVATWPVDRRGGLLAPWWPSRRFCSPSTWAACATGCRRPSTWKRGGPARNRVHRRPAPRESVARSRAGILRRRPDR